MTVLHLVPRTVPCHLCLGRGEYREPHRKTQRCPECHGRGRVDSFEDFIRQVQEDIMERDQHPALAVLEKFGLQTIRDLPRKKIPDFLEALRAQP